MTLEEKVNVTTGIGWALGRCVVRSNTRRANIIANLFSSGKYPRALSP